MASTSGAGGSKISALSRLENKYSDILDRVGRRDRDKTLEPNENYNPLARSATTHQLLSAKPKLSSNSFNAADRKERTPYRLQKNKSRYLGDSNDSGYLTTASTTNGRGHDTATSTLLDDNYPLDYGSSRYRAGAHNYGNNYDHRYQDEYNPSTSRYNRTGEYASSYKPRSGLDYSNYYDGSRLGPRGRQDDYLDTTASSSSGGRRQKSYGRNKTCDSLVSAEGEILAGGRPRYEPPPDVTDTSHSHLTNSRNRFAHKRPQMSSVGSSTHRTDGTSSSHTSNELTAEELEILNDDRSSADNAAILLALRDDGQYLEAKKFEERMRTRTELKERMTRYAQEAEKAKELKKLQEEQDKSLQEQVEKHAKELAGKQTVTDTTAAVSVSVKKPEEQNGTLEEEKTKSTKKSARTKKVTTQNTEDTDDTSSSDEEEEDDDEETETSSDDNSTKENNTNKTNTATSTVPDTTSSTSTKANATATTSITSTKDNTDSNTTSSTNNHDKNNNDLSKYRPQPIPKTNTTSTSTSAANAGLMHSSSSGALAFGGISERLGASNTTRTQKPYSGATSRTAAVLSEFENSSRYPTTGTRADRYGLGDLSYKPSNHYDPYTSAYSTAASSSRRAGAAAAASGSSYQRQQLAAYQQQLQQQQHHYQQQNMLMKSATSSSLFHRSRIPKTYSSFVRSLYSIEFLFVSTFCILFAIPIKKSDCIYLVSCRISSHLYLKACNA